ncbi:MAG: DNA-directed RNA polymerase subunit L [Nanoarchaeota archaeon]
MELNILEHTKKRLVFELKGADHTFCNLLKNELWQDKDVKISTYAINHPLIGNPKLIIETKENETEKALTKALDRLEEKNKEFLTSFKRAR